jgi:hypothetical protein
MTARSLTCPNCRVLLEDRDKLRSCPSCGADLGSSPLPGLPPDLATNGGELQEPEFARESGVRQDDTAPMSEFVAAGAVLAGALLLVAGAVVASGTLALIGVVLMFGVTGFFAITRGAMSRALIHYRDTIWGGFRRGRHDDPGSQRTRERD